MLNCEWDNLRAENNYNKIDLVTRQVIGFMQLVECTPYMRFIFARGQVYTANAGRCSVNFE